MTHPFHLLSGQQLVCRGERYNRYGMTLLLETEDGSVCSVPPQWTDLVAPDPEIVMGERRALFRVVDLLELTRLVERLMPGDTPEERGPCEGNSAACVKCNVPHPSSVGN